MKKFAYVLPLIATALFTMAHAQTAPVEVAPTTTLSIGDKAPALAIAKWVKGKPVEKFGTDKVYVVEFWATWCGPCIQTIPHLTELAKKHQGKVDFIGVDVYEDPTAEDTSYFKTVEDFVAKMGDKMDYNVGIDGLEAKMAKTWMEAAGQEGIPTAFIVDKKGMIAWIGHPMEMDEPLAQVVDGTYDIEAAKKSYAEQMAMQQDLAVVGEELTAALEAGDFTAAVQAIDAGINKNSKLLPILAGTKVSLLFVSDEPAAYKQIAEYAAHPVIQKDAMVLNEMAWSIVDPEAELVSPDYKLALRVAELAAKASKHEDAAILDTLALSYFKNGDKTNAIKWQEKAVELAKKDEAMPAEMLKDLEERLAEFKK